ncbi:hypothetical protein [Salinisphaera sp. T5B8]|uniref:hypothetical protein n=1 Tax=Salinisphaera sp. T5B8 TaxID=1304154 RepID=UPI0033407726
MKTADKLGYFNPGGWGAPLLQALLTRVFDKLACQKKGAAGFVVGLIHTCLCNLIRPAAPDGNAHARVGAVCGACLYFVILPSINPLLWHVSCIE